MLFLTGNVGPTAWNIWPNLFHEKVGTHALIMVGYATPSNFVTDELLAPIIQWMSYAPRRNLSIYFGLEADVARDKIAEQRTNIIAIMKLILETLQPSHRKNVHIHLIPNLHAKIYAIYDEHPLNANAQPEAGCRKLLMGSSNLSYTAFSKNFEFDVYMRAPEDEAHLNDAAYEIKKLLGMIHFGTEPKPTMINLLEVEDSLIGEIWGADSLFYEDIISEL